MPFPKRPVGFSNEALDLLDQAMNLLWLEQVAIGAAVCGVRLPTAVIAQLDDLPVRRHPSSKRSTRDLSRKPRGER